MRQFFPSPLGIGIAVFIVVLGLGLVLKTFGFHVQGVNFVRGGDVAVLLPDVEARIFFDERTITYEGSTALIENSAPGPHSLLIFNDAYWPWKKDINVRPNTTLSVRPFLIKKNPTGEIITTADSDFFTLRNEIIAESLPTESAPRVSGDAQIHLWSTGNVLYATWQGSEQDVPEFFCDDGGNCSATIEVLSTVETIRNADFYKDTSHIAVVAFSNGVFAIELDTRGGTQNFQPIYKGTEDPRFKRIDSETLHVLDGSALFIVDL